MRGKKHNINKGDRFGKLTVLGCSHRDRHRNWIYLCTWATRSEQQRNRRTNRMITAFGHTQSVVWFADAMSIPYNTLTTRLRRGWPVMRALTEAIHKKDTHEG